MSNTPTPARIEAALENVDFNINMFSRYKPNEYNTRVLESLRAERVELVELAEGKRTYDSLCWPNRERFFEMPAWGTRGT